MVVSQWYCDLCKHPVDPTTFRGITIGAVRYDICETCFIQIAKAVQDIRDPV